MPPDPFSEWAAKEGFADNDSEPARPTVQLSQLLAAILAFLKRYIVFPSEDAAVAAALWVAHTWPFQSFDYTPYLHIFSPVKFCGKSKLLECLKLLCRAPWCSILPSEAVLFRKIEAHCPSVLLDEIDTVFTNGKNGAGDPNKEGLRAVLNAGYERGATVPRCQGPNHTLRDFSVFCPKAIASIGNLPDTIASRSMKIALSRKRKTQEVTKFRWREAIEQARPITEALEAWSERQSTLDKLRDARPHMPDGLSDRQEDICEPLLAIADLAGGDWPKRARGAISKLFATSTDTDDEETKIQLLTAIREIFQQFEPKDATEDFFQKTNLHISSKSLLEKLVARDGEPWALLWNIEDIESGKIKGPAARLAKLLKPFGIVSRTIRLKDGTTPKGYPLAVFQEHFDAYLPPLSTPKQEDEQEDPQRDPQTVL